MGRHHADGGDRPDDSLYRFDANGGWRTINASYHVTNGPAFSPDQRTLYHADSPRGVVYRFDLDETGEPRSRRIFAAFPKGWGFPDGMTVDAHGCLRVALWGRGLRLTLRSRWQAGPRHPAAHPAHHKLRLRRRPAE